TALSYQFLSSSASSRSAVFAEISGLLGDVKVARCETSYQHGGEALGGRWRVSGMLGVAQPLGETTLPWEERFFLGGSFGAQRLMGFGPHGLGPTAYTERESKARLGLVQGLGGLGLQRSGPIIEKTRSSFMGGDSCASLEALMQFPLGPLQLMTFGAAGLLVNRSQVASLPDLTGSLRASFGAGIGYPLPGGGHIAATFTLPVQAVEGDHLRPFQELPRTAEPEQEEQVGISQMQELQARIEDLEEAVQQERVLADESSKSLQEMTAATRRLCTKHQIPWSTEELSLAMLEKLEEAFSRLQLADDAREHEQKAMQQKTSQLQEEVEFLRSAKFEADDRCQQLEVELKQAKNSVSAQALQLESQFRESQMEQLQAVDQARGEAEAYQRRAKMAEAQLQTAQAAAERFSTEFYQLEARFAEEQLIRKKYHNQIQDMKGSVRVFCRFRPLAKREEDLGDIPVLHKADAFSVDLQRLAPHNDTRRFDFDAVFGGDSPQEEVFRDCEDLVQSVVDGYNVTIFAYGQTGAGKTHTMYGTHDHPGLAPRSIDSLFHLIHREERQGRKSFTVKAYMIELYKQEILDLLVEARRENSKEKQLQIKKDAGRGIMFVEGVCERQIHGPDELKAVLAEGERRRHTAATAMNTSSSRSHLLLSIIVEATAKDNDQVIYGKITLCDLAGSERLKKSEVSGDALKEAIEINKSLTALGDVIEALSKGSKNVPYRNHKLTMLMQDSLGGSAKTLMFVNCSPASSNAEETLTSLKWATRAKQVTNDVKRLEIWDFPLKVSSASSPPLALIRSVLQHLGEDRF
ncbi:Kinesin-like protein KIN-14I (Kinesin-like calmodulin-binding protein) (OsKCBP), partial [Durusdinium trenchii]